MSKDKNTNSQQGDGSNQNFEAEVIDGQYTIDKSYDGQRSNLGQHDQQPPRERPNTEGSNQPPKKDK